MGETQIQKSCFAAADGNSREMGVVYYSSETGNTQNFVERLGVPAVRLNKTGEQPQMKRPYVLVMPTYADGEGRGALPKAAIRFLNIKENRDLLRGVVASGNRNFGLLYACAGDVIAYKCGVPCLYRYELRGMPDDIVNVRNILADMQS